MNRVINITIILLLFFASALPAQNQLEQKKLPADTLTLAQSKAPAPAQIISASADTGKVVEFRPDPLKVIWMGAVIPGYGQILNKKYWKLPLVYGGFLGFAYAITWNSGRYQTYKNAYRDIIDSNPGTNSFIEILPKGRTIENMGGMATYTSTLKTAQDAYRRYRDVSIIGVIAYYGITLVDAYVDAQLYNFDISPDLSLRFEPTLLHQESGYGNALGMRCRLNIK